MLTQAELRRQEYLARINRALDHIDANLGGALTLDELADAACFSRFHFHRLFSALVGETLADYIRRVRLQRAAARLTQCPKDSITTVALDCGFSSPSVFARAFRERFGVSASDWRRSGGVAPGSAAAESAAAGGRKERKAESKGGQAKRKGGQAGNAAPPYDRFHQPERRKAMEEMEKMDKKEKIPYTVEVKELPELLVAYVRHVGPFQQIGQAFERLMRWAGPRGLLRFPQTKSLAVYHDSPEVTETGKLRSDACITVPEGTQVEGEVGLLRIPGGKFAVGRFEITAGQFGQAWDALMGEWLPQSGWQPDDRMCYELYLNDPQQHPQHRFIVDICEPVRPL